MTDNKAVVLTIDDEETIRRTLRDFLEDNGYSVLEAENGRIGLEVFERERPDIALVDLRMPEVDGLEVLTKINEISPETPLIVVSGTGVIADAIEALRLGAWGYVLKPIEDMSVLLHAVEKALERFQLIRENRNYQEHLERQVAIRTEELKNTNIQLKEEINERRRAEEKIQRFNKELEKKIAERTAEIIEANKELESFSYSVSHDLRAPLRHIMGFSEMLKNELASDITQKGANYIAFVIESSKKMSTLIDSLLEFSRMSRADINPIKIDMNDLVKKVIKELGPDISGKNIRWEIGKIPEAYGDRSLLLQVLINLVSNAVKYSGKMEKSLIEIGSTVGKSNSAVYFVKDNGAGFDMKYADKLFGVFQRLHHEKEFEGIGIGLALVNRIIKRHGGKIWAESEIDKGTTFYFSLPNPNHEVEELK